MLVRFAPLLLATAAFANTAYYNRVLFDNSPNLERHFYSSGRASAPSKLELNAEKVPVARDRFHTPPNSLRLHWTSDEAGGWAAEIVVDEWRNRNMYFPGSELQFWCYSVDGLQASKLPRLGLHDTAKNFTAPFDLSAVSADIPPAKWTKISVRLDLFTTASLHSFDGHRIDRILFSQGAADDREHTLLIDDIHVDSLTAISSQLPLVQNVAAKGFERHVDVSWQATDNRDLQYYEVERSTDGEFKPVGIQVPGIHRLADWLGKSNVTAKYRVTAFGWNGERSQPSASVSASTRTLTDDELLTMVQEACFRYYWDGAHPVSGLTRENLPGDDEIVAMGASGFGVLALVVGVERQFISREQGIQRMLQLTKFLSKADRYHGVWPHFLNGTTGRRLPVFGTFENGADLVETSFLLQGLLTARQYFSADNPDEKKLRQTITDLWQSIDWSWFRRTPDGDALFWHWSPEYSWFINHRLTGFNETMITYLLAIASSAHGVPASLYQTGWAGQSKAAVEYRQAWGQEQAGDHYVNGHVYDGIKLDVGVNEGGPLFFTQYSYLAFDPNATDQFTNYFKNAQAQTLINHAYCLRNPNRFQGYGPDCWGITAVDGPEGYNAYEPKKIGEDGTIAPTGALGSFPYTPEFSLRALKYFYREQGEQLWGEFGFRDAFNLQRGWFSQIYMGLNQAPIVVMIENYRTKLLWKTLQSDREIQSMRKQLFRP